MGVFSGVFRHPRQSDTPKTRIPGQTSTRILANCFAPRHPGGLSTLHANSAPEALGRLEDLLAETAARVSRRAVGQAIDVRVHIARTPVGRRVEAVTAVEGGDDQGHRLRPLAYGGPFDASGTASPISPRKT